MEFTLLVIILFIKLLLLIGIFFGFHDKTIKSVVAFILVILALLITVKINNLVVVDILFAISFFAVVSTILELLETKYFFIFSLIFLLMSGILLSLNSLTAGELFALGCYLLLFLGICSLLIYENNNKE